MLTRILPQWFGDCCILLARRFVPTSRPKLRLRLVVADADCWHPAAVLADGGHPDRLTAATGFILTSIQPWPTYSMDGSAALCAGHVSGDAWPDYDLLADYARLTQLDRLASLRENLLSGVAAGAPAKVRTLRHDCATISNRAPGLLER